MIKFCITLICSMFSVAIYSQEKKELTGPTYKNQLPWKTEVKEVKLYTISTANVTGPQAKNATPGIPKDAELTQVKFRKPQKQETGPKYKNRKPGEL